MTKKLITFSLWGSEEKYTVGACRNVILAQKLYPDWTCRFYVDRNTVPLQYQMMLAQAGNGTELVDMPGGMRGWKGMFARFLPASEDDVDVFISRDCDSRLSEREAKAVQEWLDGPKLVHSMGDHPHHFNPSYALMGGMFGMKKYACPQMSELIKQFCLQYPDAWQCDQDFLKQHVFPLIAHKVHAASDIHPGCHRFPIPRDADNFIGSIIGPNEERLHPEHHAILK